jgi:hypothetical protein
MGPSNAAMTGWGGRGEGHHDGTRPIALHHACVCGSVVAAAIVGRVTQGRLLVVSQFEFGLAGAAP